MQEPFLWELKVSLLEKCPSFRGVVREGSTTCTMYVCRDGVFVA